MIIELQSGIDPTAVLRAVQAVLPYAKAVTLRGQNWVVCPGAAPTEWVQQLHGVARIIETPLPYPLASRAFADGPTVVRVGSVRIGSGAPVIIAGPCSVESRDQILATARHLAATGCQMLRGGAFKPRTSPYSFQGLQEAGLHMLAEARAQSGLPFVTEVLAPSDVALVAAYADMLQIGARNMQNFALLREAGRSGRPVLLKRSPWANLSTWLQAAEYILAEGNDQVVLCERGVVGSEAASGRQPDLAAVPRLRKLTHLPVVVDPSHGTGESDLVVPMALAALVVGADGLMVEVHPNPSAAFSDGPQSLTFAQFTELQARCAALRNARACM